MGIGQDSAVRAISNAIIRSRAGLTKRCASFLFLGSTGTGKTELAKAVTRELFDDEKNMVRFDMSEFMEKHAVSKLIGSPPGYVGFDQGGALTEAIKRKPYSVILFDEIEKAHPDVLNILLQLLDDGRLTDSHGDTIDFSNTLVILTSNIGSSYLLPTETKGADFNSISSYEEEDSDDDVVKINHETINSRKRKRPSDDLIRANFKKAKKMVMNDVRVHLRPELLNRLDEIVIFKPLTESILKKIVKLQVQEVMSQLKSDRNITVECTDEASALVVDLAYDPRYGARPIRRWVERHIATDISKAIIRGEVLDGSVIVIDLKDQDAASKPNETLMYHNLFSLVITPPPEESSKL